MEQAVEEEVIIEVSSGIEGSPPRVLGEATGVLSGSAAEGERLIAARDVVGWSMAEGTADPGSTSYTRHYV